MLGRSRATHYRQPRAPLHGPPTPRPPSHRALSDIEHTEILDVLNSERFCDQAPAQIWATLLDDDIYLASVSTMYRIPRTQHQVHERRQQARHPARSKPELMADGPPPPPPPPSPLRHRLPHPRRRPCRPTTRSVPHANTPLTTPTPPTPTDSTATNRTHHPRYHPDQSTRTKSVSNPLTGTRQGNSVSSTVRNGPTHHLCDTPSSY